jgi:hypothetical protein
MGEIPMSVSSPAVAALPRERSHQRADRIYFTTMSLVIFVVVFAGFSPSFFLAPYFERPALTLAPILHGVVNTAWLVLLVSQSVLVARGNLALHRRLGVMGMVLAAAVFVGGVAMSLRNVNIATPERGDLRPFMIIPFGDALLFGGLVLAAFWYRRKPDYHKRFMVLANLNLVAPAAARLVVLRTIIPGPYYFWIFVNLLVVAGPIYDLTRGRRLHPAYLWGGLAIILAQPLRIWLMFTPEWLWFVDLITNP